jgi:hypothetical protein
LSVEDIHIKTVERFFSVMTPGTVLNAGKEDVRISDRLEKMGCRIAAYDSEHDGKTKYDYAIAFDVDWFSEGKDEKYLKKLAKASKSGVIIAVPSEAEKKILKIVKDVFESAISWKFNGTFYSWGVGWKQ